MSEFDELDETEIDVINNFSNKLNKHIYIYKKPTIEIEDGVFNNITIINPIINIIYKKSYSLKKLSRKQIKHL